MKRQTKWLLMGLFLLMGVLVTPTAATKVQAAARMNYSSVKLKQGKSMKLKVKGTSAKIQWSSSKPNVVSVNSKGKITTIKGGNAVITAKTKKKQFKCKVYVVGLNTSRLTMNKGATYTLKAKNGKNTKWSTSNKKVASVTAKGKVKAKNNGTAVITCKTAGRTIKCKVYVASLSTTSLRLTSGSQYHLSVLNAGDTCKWSTANGQVASVDQNGIVTAVAASGSTTITCKTGKATLTCAVKAVSPGNIVTPMSSLPSTSIADILDVTVESYPGTRTYKVYRQSAEINKTDGKSGVDSSYMPNHGCAACAASTVLSGYANMNMGPIYMTQSIEKNLFGSAWKDNYNKSSSKQMPISLYGITKVLDAYHISNEYVRQFDPATALQQITNHLKTGNAVVIEVKNLGNDKRWANSKHTMVLLGMTDSGLAIVADSADRTNYFGNQRRIKYASVMSLLPYMFSCTNTTSTSVYYTSESACGGYILVNPQ